MATPVLVAAVATARTQRARPTLRWDHAAVRGGVGGMLAGVLVAALASLAGGSVGPGRMRNVGVDALDVLVHALPAFAIGGLVGALVSHLVAAEPPGARALGVARLLSKRTTEPARS